MAGAGLNWIRLPVPWWMIETISGKSIYQRQKTQTHTHLPIPKGEPHLEGAQFEWFVKAINWCRKYGIRIKLDLHSVPGSQVCPSVGLLVRPSWLLTIGATERLEPLGPCHGQSDRLSRWPDGYRQRRTHSQLPAYSGSVYRSAPVHERRSYDGCHQRAPPECHRRRPHAILVRLCFNCYMSGLVDAWIIATTRRTTLLGRLQVSEPATVCQLDASSRLLFPTDGLLHRQVP
jgi:hypothetical protein